MVGGIRSIVSTLVADCVIVLVIWLGNSFRYKNTKKGQEKEHCFRDHAVQCCAIRFQASKLHMTQTMCTWNLRQKRSQELGISTKHLQSNDLLF